MIGGNGCEKAQDGQAENSKGEGAAPSFVFEGEQPVSEQPQAQPHCQGQRCVHLPEVGAAPDEAGDGENDEQAAEESGDE